MIFSRKEFSQKTTTARSPMNSISQSLEIILAHERGKRRALVKLSESYQSDMGAFSIFSGNRLPYFELYWKEKNRFPFLIQYKGEPIGFALVNAIGVLPASDWNMAEFFIAKAYRRRNFGKRAAKRIIDTFPGTWEIAVIPENKQALSFWKNVIETHFPKKTSKPIIKIVQNPKPHPMKIFQITRTPLCSKSLA